MEINSISPVRTKIEQPERSSDVANNKAVQHETRERTDSTNSHETVSRSELDNAVDYANETGQLLKRKLDFTVDETTEKVVVSVIDEESGEVVRQVPPTEMLRISAHLKQLREMNDKVMGAVKSVILDVTY